MKKIFVHEYVDDPAAGARVGKCFFGQLVSLTERQNSPTIFFLDFREITVATSSFLRESVLAFRDYCSSSGSNLYPVLANVHPNVLDELRYLLEDRHDALVVCALDESETPVGGCLLGLLEEKQLETLNAVIALREADASELASQMSVSQLGITAWNNRLASLSSKRILIEIRRGRTKRYSPVIDMKV